MSKGIIVTGMQCGGCERIVEKAIGAVDGVGDVEADYESNAVRLDLTGSPKLSRIAEAVDHAGYEANIPNLDQTDGDEDDTEVEDESDDVETSDDEVVENSE